MNLTYAFNVTFTRPDEHDATVYTSGTNVDAPTRAEADARLALRYAHLTVQGVVLVATMDDEGTIVCAEGCQGCERCAPVHVPYGRCRVHPSVVISNGLVDGLCHLCERACDDAADEARHEAELGAYVPQPVAPATERVPAAPVADDDIPF